MSVVTNVMVLGLGADPYVKGLNAWLDSDTESAGQLRKIPDNAVGGPKNLESDIWLAAFNYLNVGAFVEEARRLLPEVNKRRPHLLFVQLLLKCDTDLLWHEVDLCLPYTEPPSTEYKQLCPTT